MLRDGAPSFRGVLAKKMFVAGGSKGRLPWAAFSLGDSCEDVWRSNELGTQMGKVPINGDTLAATEPKEKAEVPAARFGSQIGGTPLFDLTELAPDLPPDVKIYGKVPCGRAKLTAHTHPTTLRTPTAHPPPHAGGVPQHGHVAQGPHRAQHPPARGG